MFTLLCQRAKIRKLQAIAIKNIKTFPKVSLYFIIFYFKFFIVKTANVRRQQLLNHYTEEYCVALVIFRFIYLRYVTFHLKQIQHNCM